MSAQVGALARVTECDCPTGHVGLIGEVSDVGSRRVLVEFGAGVACAALAAEKVER